jgi:hypothetical protein
MGGVFMRFDELGPNTLTVLLAPHQNTSELKPMKHIRLLDHAALW